MTPSPGASSTEPPATWTVVIDRWRPPSLNKGRGRHWGTSYRSSVAVSEVVGGYAMKAGVRRVHDDYRPVRRVEVRLWVRANNPDPDNLLKHLLDGMKRARLIVDDSWQWCRWEQPIVSRAESKADERTEIRITDLVHCGQEPEVTPRVLVVKAYADLKTHAALPTRSVYIVRRFDHGAEECDLYTINKPLSSARELAEWARSIGLPVVEEPPGCLSDSFVWPYPNESSVFPLAAADPDLF